jgi:nitrous oxide reductase accessory protein NosL
VRLAALAGALVCALVLAAGCAREEAPPPIADGAVCANCGMTAGNRRFACEQKVDGQWRVYDSIECLAGDRDAVARLAAAAAPAGGRRARVYLADYDSRTLHAADSLAVVHGAFSSPMGGGYAAFLDRAAADSLAVVTRGRVVSLAEVRP